MSFPSWALMEPIAAECDPYKEEQKQPPFGVFTLRSEGWKQKLVFARI